MASEHDSVTMLPEQERSEKALAATPVAPKPAWLQRTVDLLQRAVDSLLYGESPGAEATRYRKSNGLVALIFFCIMMGANTYLFYIIYKAWPTESIVYYTNDPHDSTRGGKNYTGGCINSLPPSLQTLDNLPNSTNPNKCYLPSELENVTVVMFSDSSTTGPLVRKLLRQSSPNPQINEIRVGGLHVSQEAHELTAENDTVFGLLDQLYVGGHRGDIHADIKNYLLTEHFDDYPSAYMQLSWVYNCTNCTSCGPAKVINLSREVVNEAWVSCYPYAGGGWDTCSTANYYAGKCVLYPPVNLPASLAVQAFLNKFESLSGINSIGYQDDVSQDVALLRPNVLYLNISQVLSSTIPLGFFEVEKGSVMWVLLVEWFPTVGTECSTLRAVSVCNGTSFCNLFEEARSYRSYEVLCRDFTNSSQCANYKEGFVLADNLNLTEQPKKQSDIICPPSITCVEAFPYRVTMETAGSWQNDSLNSFLASNILDSEWAQRSGLCTKTYANVIRYVGDSLQETMFLETQCRNVGTNRGGFCWLTRNYHNLSDLPTANWTSLPSSSFQTSSSFAFYRMEKQTFMTWFVNGFGVQAGWIGSINFVFFGVFTWVFAPCRRFIHSHPSGASNSSMQEEQMPGNAPALEMAELPIM